MDYGAEHTLGHSRKRFTQNGAECFVPGQESRLDAVAPLPMILLDAAWDRSRQAILGNSFSGTALAQEGLVSLLGNALSSELCRDRLAQRSTDRKQVDASMNEHPNVRQDTDVDTDTSALPCHFGAK